MGGDKAGAYRVRDIPVEAGMSKPFWTRMQEWRYSRDGGHEEKQPCLGVVETLLESDWRN